MLFLKRLESGGWGVQAFDERKSQRKQNKYMKNVINIGEVPQPRTP